MSDTLRKVLLGAVAGALLVVFYSHISSERAKRDPSAKGGVDRAAHRIGGRATAVGCS